MTTLTRDDIVKELGDFKPVLVQRENRSRQELALKIADNLEETIGYAKHEGENLRDNLELLESELYVLIEILRSAQGEK